MMAEKKKELISFRCPMKEAQFALFSRAISAIETPFCSGNKSKKWDLLALKSVA